MKVKIPKHWTAEQAEAVADFIGELEFAIRKQYQVKILDHQLTELTLKQQGTYLRNINQEDF